MLGIIRRIFKGGEVDCEDVKQMSSDYIEDQLPPKRLKSVQQHLTGCGPCRAFVETLTTTIGLLSRLPRVTLPPSFKENLNSKICRER